MIEKLKKLSVGLIAVSLMGCYGVASARAFDAGEPEVLRVIWRVHNGTDLASTYTATERDSMTSDGAIYYLPMYPYSGTIPIYRYLNSAGDHRDSISSSLTGYTLEYTLGRPFSSSNSSAGLTPIYSGYNSSVPDYATLNGSETISGYTSTSVAAYGWPRYNNLATSLVSLTAGGVTVQANKVAGGAIWRWTWNGKQFLNNGQDYGRQMQTSLAWKDSTGNTPNPTEAGDKYSAIDLITAAKHGSPCVSATTSGSILSTVAVPLEWNGGSLSGCQGGPNNPVIWKDVRIGKNVTLNYNSMGPVAKYQTVLTLPAAISSSQSTNLEIPTAYLGADFNAFYTYDASSATRTKVTVSVGTKYVFVPASGFGGVILSNAAGTYAMGVYGVTADYGGSVSAFRLYNFISLNNGDTSEVAADTTKLSAIYSGDLASGTTTYTTWMMSGTLAQVQSYMNTLYASGVKK